MNDSDTDSAIEGVALLVVDLQTSLLKVVDPDGTVLQRNIFAIRAARMLGIRVMFSEQVPEKLGPTHPDLVDAAGGANSAIIFSKSEFNAFDAPGLERAFADLEDCHLLMAGIETPICIYQSALAGLARDLQITLLSDCIGARRKQDAEWALRVIAGAGATVLPSESIFYSILASADHPQFRAFTDLVKQFS